MNGRSIASGLIGVLVGCAIALGVGGWQPRYHAVQLQEGVMVRLDTQTGEMRVFVPVEVARALPDDTFELVWFGRSWEGPVPGKD